jgi:hypothetical protein
MTKALVVQAVLWCTDEMPFVCEEGFSPGPVGRPAVATGFDPYDKLRTLNAECPCGSRQHAQVVKKNKISYQKLSEYV